MSLDGLAQFWARLGRTQWRIVAVALAVVMIGVGFGVGFSIAGSNARSRKDAQTRRDLDVFTRWQMLVTAGFSKALMASMAVGGFVTTEAVAPANMSAAPTDSSRVRFVNASAWERMAADIWEAIPGMRSLEIQSGGVISQNYPPGFEGEHGLDVFNLPSDHEGYLQVISLGEVVTLGPGPLWSGGTGIYFRYPVYTARPKSADNFWGTGNVVLQVEHFMTTLNIHRLAEDDGMHYLLWYWDTEKNVDVLSSVIDFTAFASPQDARAAASQEAIDLLENIRQEGLKMLLPVAEEGRGVFGDAAD